MLETVVVVSPLTSCRTREKPCLVCLAQVDLINCWASNFPCLLARWATAQASHPPSKFLKTILEQQVDFRDMGNQGFQLKLNKNYKL